MRAGPGDITRLLNGARAGDHNDREQLADLIYGELRRLAAKIMAAERPDHTLQATVLATEAYLSLVDDTNQNWQNRAHFFSVAARAMRQVLVDYSRKKDSLKRGGGYQRLELAEALPVAVTDYDEVLTLDQALSRLARLDARQSLIVELRYFGGLTEEEIAEVLAISLRTVKREWATARAWLYAELTRRPARSRSRNQTGE
jgi:RNA polymerase sigma factor (TIGR02999 family)